MSSTVSFSHDVPIVIVGAGPVGMVLAYQLDRLNVPCLLAERSLEISKWPKLDLTNRKSMELFRILGLAEEYRGLEGSVSQDATFDTQFATKLDGKGHLLANWKLPSSAGQRAHIKDTNDGTQCAEAGQRCLQPIFESWLRQKLQTKSNISSKFGWTYLVHTEGDQGVSTTFVDQNGEYHVLHSKYLIACDGGGSRIRKTAGIPMTGGQISRQFAEERSFGKYWHTFCSHGGVILDQNDDDMFTAHLPTHLLPEGPVDPYEVVYRIMASAGQRHEIKIDEIYAHSEWAPNFSIANQYYTDSMRVILAGDSAHRMPPHGGYGMNSGVVDAVDLGWRLAAIVKGYGGELLLKSYNMERRPMQIRTLERAHRHIMEHIKLAQMYPPENNPIDDDTEEGKDLRARVGKFLEESGPETEDRGVELDLHGTPELEWTPDRYRPSTRPGSRAPHVFLKDGETSIYDLFGAEWTLIHFVDDEAESVNKESASDRIVAAAARLSIPISRVIIRDEPHVRRIWERNMVLVRPDTHVAWRADNIWDLNVNEVLQVISGKKEFSRFQPSHASADAEARFEALVKGITDGVTGGATIAQDDIA
ncbi:hypothetical protein N7509_001719 [Penicillium cosmopolitanum]|uniref:FAD-binding domain-containing protein n=1 Tax=Penicillium cosmopolitanum TaxID=1131564 RepID=A0A9X0BCQ7_9EURO|nr:uncharacterized protein N7509_001719 [Penicillium cosmopolitanum]KAJ5407836.1 hypothetical protein N7509_001719 [Penicillium cosmopolitanum]